jgi:hypothetical protein
MALMPSFTSKRMNHAIYPMAGLKPEGKEGSLPGANPGANLMLLEEGASAQQAEKDTEAGAGAGLASPKTFILGAQGFTAAVSVFMFEIKLMYIMLHGCAELLLPLGNIYRGIGTLLLHARQQPRAVPRPICVV